MQIGSVCQTEKDQEQAALMKDNQIQELHLCIKGLTHKNNILKQKLKEKEQTIRDLQKKLATFESVQLKRMALSE